MYPKYTYVPCNKNSVFSHNCPTYKKADSNTHSLTQPEQAKMSRLYLSNILVQAVSLYSDSGKHSKLYSQPSKHEKLFRVYMAKGKSSDLIGEHSRDTRSSFRTYSRKLENGPNVWPLSSLTWNNILEAIINIVESEKKHNRRGKSCQKQREIHSHRHCHWLRTRKMIHSCY